MNTTEELKERKRKIRVQMLRMLVDKEIYLDLFHVFNCGVFWIEFNNDGTFRLKTIHNQIPKKMIDRKTVNHIEELFTHLKRNNDVFCIHYRSNWVDKDTGEKRLRTSSKTFFLF